MNKTITVLIPTKNRKDLLINCIDSLLCQTVNPDNIIIVNDGSSDGTDLVIKDLAVKHKNISIINRVESGGVNAARNDGIKINNSYWIAFLDDDDLFVENAIEVMKEKLEGLNEYGVVFFNTIIKKDNSEFEGGFQFNNKLTFYDPNYYEVLTKFNLKGDCKPVFNSNIFKTNNYWFPESVNGFESVVIRKIIRDGFKIRYINDVLTIINQKSNINHISLSAPSKNPKAYFNIHIQDFKDNNLFYLKNKSVLFTKYIEMLKLCIRSGSYMLFFKFNIDLLILIIKNKIYP